MSSSTLQVARMLVAASKFCMFAGFMVFWYSGILMLQSCGLVVSAS